MSLSIRQATYRGASGFTIVGRTPSGGRVKLFAKTRRVAERLRDLVRDGHTITHMDFLTDHNQEG